ncbi:hypothetical protein LP416_26565 [Polaromonas sp. P2-4]|nr:hypothetical protein LP416_26565 [Polaromonas sp. P2-4]
MKFLVRSRGQVVAKAPRPAFVLTTDKWDDFGHEVQLHLAYLDAQDSETRVGTVKILQRTGDDEEPIAVASRTKLPASFDELGKGFISLGQEEDYYKNLHQLLGRQVGGVLSALRDIAWQPALAADFEPTSAFLQRDDA